MYVPVVAPAAPSYCLSLAMKNDRSDSFILPTTCRTTNNTASCYNNTSNLVSGIASRSESWYQSVSVLRFKLGCGDGIHFAMNYASFRACLLQSEAGEVRYSTRFRIALTFNSDLGQSYYKFKIVTTSYFPTIAEN